METLEDLRPSDTPAYGESHMPTATRPRPRTLSSSTTKLNTEEGKLYVTVSLDEDGKPFEVFGTIGKAGSFTSGVTEAVCRLVSLHLRRSTPLDEVIGQLQGISEMQPFANQLSDGANVWVRGLADGIAHILKHHHEGKEIQDCVLEEDTGNLRRQKRDARYRGYVEAVEHGMTVKETMRTFGVSKSTVYRALAWARQEGVSSEVS